MMNGLDFLKVGPTHLHVPGAAAVLHHTKMQHCCMVALPLLLLEYIEFIFKEI